MPTTRELAASAAMAGGISLTLLTAPLAYATELPVTTPPASADTTLEERTLEVEEEAEATVGGPETSSC